MILAMILSLSPAAPDARDAIEAIRTAHEANREALSRGTIRFRYVYGRASRLEEALEGEAGSQVATDQGLHVFDLPHGRFEITYPLDVLGANLNKVGGQRFPTTPLNPVRALTDGKLSLIDNIGVSPDGSSLNHGVLILPGPGKFHGEAVTPLDLGADPRSVFLGLSRYIDRALDDASGYRLATVEDDILDGVEVVRVEIETEGGRYHFWVDLDRGAIPLRTQTIAPATGETTTLVYDDLRQVAGGAWYPFRSVYFMEALRVSKETVVLDADFEARPDPASFRLEFEEPIGVENKATKVLYAPQKVWDLRRLPTTSRPFVYADTGPPPEMPGEREPPRRWHWLAVPVAVVIAAVGWLSYRRLSG